MKEVLRQSEDNYHLMKERGIQAFERMLRKEGVQSFKLAGIQRYRGRGERGGLVVCHPFIYRGRGERGGLVVCHLFIYRGRGERCSLVVCHPFIYRGRGERWLGGMSSVHLQG